VFTPPRQRGPGSSEPGEEFAQDQVDNATPPRERGPEPLLNDAVATAIGWVVRIVLVLLVLTVVALLLRALIARVRRDLATPKDEATADVVPDVLLRGVREGERRLGRGTSSEAVINAWLALEEMAVATGLPDDAARTPAELVEAVLERYAVQPAAVGRLAELYREARFSEHLVTEDQREEARTALAAVRADLTASLGRLTGAAGGAGGAAR